MSRASEFARLVHLAVDVWCVSYLPACTLETVVCKDNWSKDEKEVTCEECLVQWKKWQTKPNTAGGRK